MFCGFRSRCTIPFSCAASSASAICRAIARLSSSGERPGVEPLAKRRTLDELHDQCAHAAGIFEAEDRGDVRVVELREELRFALEAREALLVGSERRRQHLDRHLALELRVGRALHLPHPALAQLGGDLVGAQLRADQEPPPARPERALCQFSTTVIGGCSVLRLAVTRKR